MSSDIFKKSAAVLLVPAFLTLSAVSGWAESQPGTTPGSDSGGSQLGTVAPQAPLPTPGYSQPPARPVPVEPPVIKRKPPKRAIPPEVKMPGPSAEIGLGSYYDSITINAPVDYAWRWQFNPYGVVVNGASRVGDWGGTAGVALSVRKDGKADLDAYVGTRSGEALKKWHTRFDAPVLSQMTKNTEKQYNIDRNTQANQSEIYQIKPDDNLRLRTPIYLQINKAPKKAPENKPDKE